jgi:hypothetical protein
MFDLPGGKKEVLHAFDGCGHYAFKDATEIHVEASEWDVVAMVRSVDNVYSYMRITIAENRSIALWNDVVQNAPFEADLGRVLASINASSTFHVLYGRIVSCFEGRRVHGNRDELSFPVELHIYTLPTGLPQKECKETVSQTTRNITRTPNRNHNHRPKESESRES